MLKIIVPRTENFNDVTQQFTYTDETQLELEHSLFSLSKWESKWEKPFLGSTGSKEKTTEEVLSYIQDMTLTPNIPEAIFAELTPDNFTAINTHMNAKMTATWFNEKGTPKGPQEVITAELIYHWMVALTIPFECQHWHLNRLLALIKVCNIKNNPEKAKKMSAGELAARNRRINEERQKQYGTSG